MTIQGGIDMLCDRECESLGLPLVEWECQWEWDWGNGKPGDPCNTESGSYIEKNARFYMAEIPICFWMEICDLYEGVLGNKSNKLIINGEVVRTVGGQHV